MAGNRSPYHQQLQLAQRPQSLRVSSVALPLQDTLRQASLPFIKAISSSPGTVHLHNNRQYLPVSQNPSNSSGLTDVPNPASNFFSDKQRQQQMHPQIWCGKGQTQPAASKLVYNYAQRKDAVEKTPMCKVAELARYNKLRHEYMLLDESGPAHKKKFTVKLVLCSGQEFEGSGPSIKKAQQAAAQCALDLTTLPKISPNRGIRRTGKKADEQHNPILLLNSVAAQLNITANYREEAIRQPIAPKIALSPTKATNPPSILHQFPLSLSAFSCPPPALFAPHSSYPFSPNKNLASILDFSNPILPFSPKIGCAIPLTFASIPSMLNNGGNFPLLTNGFSIPPTPYLPGSPMNGASLLGPIQNIAFYKVTITLSLDSSEHIGIGPNLFVAKQKAATQALAHLKPELERLKLEKEGQHIIEQSGEQHQLLLNAKQVSSPQSDNSSSTENESTTPEQEDAEFHEYEGEKQHPRQRKKSKSVVSKIHECALRLRMNIEFEVLGESGEPHNRIYTIRCRLSSPPLNGSSSSVVGEDSKEFVAEGHGPSKKAAKQAACQKLLEQHRQLLVDDDPIQLANQIVRRANGTVQKRSGVIAQGSVANKEFVKRKTIIKDKKMDPDYGHHINPISRLIQVMQVRQGREPIFKLMAENGQNRHKEFVVSVQCMGLEEQGMGPNKKLAKRSAAEAMLARIGYVKPMPQPGKSLLKKKSTQNGVELMEIGLFDPNSANWNGEEAGRSQRNMDNLETFADVEQELFQQEEKEENTGDGLAVGLKHGRALSPSPDNSPQRCISPDDPDGREEGSQPIRSQNRRVTFSELVSACPPPEDSNYPAAQIAPLKSELGGKLKRRSRDSQKMLSAEEVEKLVSAARQFLSWRNAERDKKGLLELEEESGWKETEGLELLKTEMAALGMTDGTTVTDRKPTPLLASAPPPSISASFSLVSPAHAFPLKPTLPTAFPLPLLSPLLPNNSVRTNALEGNGKIALVSAKTFLDHLAKQFKFTVAYSDFPKTKNTANEEQCFTLLTLGLAKPIVCHGSGLTESDAHNDAAFNTIRNSLSKLDSCN